ncbi:MAG: synaptic vesicle VAT-1 family membrane protein [Spirochaetota bacterium]
MEQVWITKNGPEEVLKVREASDPAVGPGEVLIDVNAAGVNFADHLARMGMYPDAPKIPTVVGYEVAGVVREVGGGAAALAPGDRVFAFTRFGGYSSVVSLPATQVFPLPKNLSFEEGAAIPVNYATAYLALYYLGGLREGESVLIHSAGGGVGIAGTQLAKLRGARVFGTASSWKHDFIRKNGVDHPIDYRSLDFAEAVRSLTEDRGVDLIIDAVGGESFEKGYNLLAPLGRLVCFGVSSLTGGSKRNLLKALIGLAKMPKFRPIALMNDNRSVAGLNLGHLWGELPRLRTAVMEMAPHFESGALKPVIAEVVPFSRAPDAHRLLAGRKNIGKVVLKPGE